MTMSTKPSRAGKGLVKDVVALVALKNAAGAYGASKFRAYDLAVLRRDGVVAEGVIQIPGDEVESQPHPEERVCFCSFVHQGLSFPVHSFLRGLLFSYQAQLHDLTPMTFCT